MISSILLSAGLSQRFGSPKALAKLNETTTVIEHLQNVLLETQIDEIIIVLGADSTELKPYILNHKMVKFVYNKDYKLGQTSSFKTGLKEIAADSQAVLLLPIDYPFIKIETIESMIICFNNMLPNIIIPTYQEIKGHPPIFHTKLKSELLNLDDTVGINMLAQMHEKQTVFLPVDDQGILLSFNTKKGV